ncbi:MAG: ABC transporter ATP-binding protein [Acidobacteria bacterium]|nr:ABC transporter ATP-binding protein [Acidobacteriota bacterium]
MSATIAVRNLYKQYNPPRGPVALHNVTLDVAGGTVLSLLGPNGAGKTTLIAILCGVIRPTAGDAFIAGYSIVQAPLDAKRLLGVVPEEVALYPRLSARQNLRYFGQLYGLRGRTLRLAIDEVLHTVGLAERADERVAHYSQGMKRRLNVGVALLPRPPVLLMDEPTVGLDPEGRRRILDLVAHLKHEFGTTILYTTHHMEEAQELSDQVAIIHQGRIIAQGAPDALIQKVHPQDMVRFRVRGPTLPPNLLRHLGEVAGVEEVALRGDTITISLLHTAQALPRILHLLEEARVPVRSLTVDKPNLETVFLRLTGAPLQEESP